MSFASKRNHEVVPSPSRATARREARESPAPLVAKGGINQAHIIFACSSRRGELHRFDGEGFFSKKKRNHSLLFRIPE